MNRFDVWFHVGEREDGARLFLFETTGKLCMQVPIVRHTGDAHVNTELHVPERVQQILRKHGYRFADAS